MGLISGVGPLLCDALVPVARIAVLVRDSDHENIVGFDCVNEGVRKPRQQTSPHRQPYFSPQKRYMAQLPGRPRHF